ncbi:TPA: hypothetical protein N0F65_008069 [Lagenidium giganteum]|uniref:Tryptophan synthase beta chain-like PALP domain-containing protein n=1 Tax=Lagenidium giganteum TaxID=4803 RepID=A0AAV2YT89_9STRA|nr:TPA: hypothetical protein N0F65_008069 [Lagenidium giganteum]
MPASRSPVTRVTVRDHLVHVKRDDVFHLAGNKMRKLYWFLRQDARFYEDAHLVSYGGTQSNAMLAIAQVAHKCDVPFTYFSRSLPSTPLDGNLATALELGMNHVELSADEYKQLVQTHDVSKHIHSTTQRSKQIFIPQGAAFPQAREGIAVLADEINQYVQATEGDSTQFAVVVPCGTGTTAFYLAQHVHPATTVFAVPCVGDAAYLHDQFQALIKRDPELARDDQHCAIPTVLVPHHKARFGRLSWPLLDMYHELLDTTHIEFDLLYGCFAWQTLMDALPQVLGLDRANPRQVMYVHSGGVSGNASMLARYATKLRNFTEMMRSLGYPRPISVENFRKPNFELVSDLLYWMVKKYDPSSSVSEEIDTEEDRVEFLTQIASEVLLKARIRLNPKKLYAADGFAVKELIKLARVLYEASRIDVANLDADDDDDEVSVKSLLGSRVKDPKATRQLAHDITQCGAKLYDLLEAELEVRDLRQQAIRFLDAISNNTENSSEQKYLERSIKEILHNTSDNVEMTERQCVELEAEEKALAAKIKKAQTDLERAEKRLKSLQNVRPAFMDEYEKLEKELERQYAVYCERFRNLDYLQRELDLHTMREMKKLAENDRSLKKLQKKFRDDELAILRGEQEDQIENSLLDPVENNNGKNGAAAGNSSNNNNNRKRSTATNQKGKAPDNKNGAASNGAAGTVKKRQADEDDSGSDADSGSDDDDGTSEESNVAAEEAAASGSDSDEVSLADSAELIDNDDDSGSEGNSEGSKSGRLIAMGEEADAATTAAPEALPAVALFHRRGSSTGGSSPNVKDSAHFAVANEPWIVQKLKHEWSSTELGMLLTRDKITEALPLFQHMKTPIKVRFLMAFLSMRKEDFEECKFAVVELVDAAENDPEEWVKIGAGLVKQYLFLGEDGAGGDSFLHERLAMATEKVLAAVDKQRNQHAGEDDVAEEFFCCENAYLNPSVRPEFAVKAAQHFSVAEDLTTAKHTGNDERSSQKKAPLHRPQIPRPSLHTGAASSVPSRLTPTTKPPPPPKKNLTELSSEIRRKADAGRFKRQRSRISMIDIDEVKQIESEKAQKAEERKKQKLTKDKSNAAASTADGSGAAAAEDGSNTAATGNDGTGHAGNSSPEEGQESMEDADNSGHASDNDDDRGNANFAQKDGTQVLLHAALHSTGDIMSEVVSQHSTHRGFEHEEAPPAPQFGFRGFGGYNSQFGDQPGNDSNQYSNGFLDEQPTSGGTNRSNSNSGNGFGDGPDYWR